MPLYGAGSGQPLDSDLTAIAALSTTAFGRALLELANAGAGRTALELGTAATHAHGDYEVAGAAAAAQAASQPLDSDLTAVAALTTTAYGRALLALADDAAARAEFDVPSNSDLSDHSADTTSVHGIADTSALATDAELAASWGTYRTVLQTQARFTASGASGNKYWFVPGTQEVVNLGTGTAGFGHAFMVNLLAADFAVAGLTTKLRLSVVMQTFSTAPGVTTICNLYPVTAAAPATLGTAVADSTVTFTTPGASGIHPATSGDFSLPSDGVHAVGFTLSGTPLSNNFMFAQLQVRNVP